MVNEGIVLGHKIFERGIEVDKAKVDKLRKCHVLKILKVFVVFLVMLVSIGDLLKTSIKFLGLLLIICKKMFHFYYDVCVEAFEILKKALISAPIVQPPD